MTAGTSPVEERTPPSRGRGDLVSSRVAAARARRSAQPEGAAPLLAREPSPPERDGPDPLSSAQRRLWFLQQLEPGSAAYNIPVVWDVDGDLDAARLRAAWQQVVRRHHVLRTRITTVDDQPLPVLDEEPADQWRTVRTSDVDADTRALVAEPFDLAAAQPWRVLLLRTGPASWRLAAVVHHVAADGWSVRVLMDDLARAYSGAELEPLAWQYADVARHRLHAAADRAGLEHWTRHLEGAPAVLALPTDRPRPATARPEGDTVTLHLPRESVDGLRALCAATGATPFVAVLSALRTVLARWAATEDVVVGTPVAGRTVAAWEHLVGCFVNTVALRTVADGRTRVRDLVRHVQDVTLHGLEHQDVPFEEVVDAVAPVRDVSTTPLYQVLLTVHTEPEPRLALGGAACTWVDVAVPVAKNDLSLHVVGGALDLARTDEDLVVQATYRTALFDRTTVERLLGHLGAVLARLPASLDLPAATVPLMTAAEQSRLPSDVGADVAAPAAHASSLPDAVRAVAREHPDRPAVRSRDEQLTYAALVAAGDRLASRLRAEGVGRGDRVGLLLERSCDVVVGMLAAMSVGAAYVPLEPAYPQERLRSLVSGAELRIVVSQPHLAGRPGEEVPVLVMDATVEDPVLEDWTQGPAEDVAPRPDDVAYVLFTSGTTGLPKGVEVEHRHLLAYLEGLRTVTGFEDGWSWAMVTTPSSDLGLTNLFGALTSGGLVHLLTYEQATDPDAVAAYLAEHPVDAMKLVPSQLGSWLGARAAADVLPRRLLVLAGEACPWELVDAVHRAAPDLAVHNHYGPTETTVSTMAHPVPRGRRTSTGSVVPLGRPFPGTRAHVVDAALRPVPTGVPGELVLAGPTVARGYLGRPDLTAERWVAEPPGGPGGRAYRSGDLVRRLPSGDLEFLGRVDDQVKIRGYRVEPGEVATVARQAPGVADCVVVAREDRPGTRTLAAYVTGRADAGPPDPETLRHHLRAHLPDHMVPADVVVLDALPLTRNGKLDRAALPAPDPRARAAGRAREPLRTPAEQHVARVWAEVLGVEDVGAADSFFDLGGDSFSAVRAVRALDRGLSVVDLFTRPTVRELAALCEAGATDDGPDPAPRMLRRLDRGVGAATTTHLVCLPYGGGSAVTFMPLAEQVGPGTAVHGVDLPGHDPGRRTEETRPLEVVAEELADEIAALDGDVVIYGHCLGGALAVRTALAVEARGRSLLGVVVAGTFPAARLPGPLARLLDRVIPSDRWLSDRAYHDMLRSLGGFTDVVDPEDRAFLVRALRHDSREAEGYYTRRFAREETGSGADRLVAPMLCVVGERDRATELYEERFTEWEEFADDVELAVVPAAGHYFLKHQAEELAELLRDRVRAWRSGARPRSRSAVPAGETARTSTFLRVALTQLMSMLGTGLTSFALGIWVLQETGSVTRFALISVMAVTPAIALSPLAGAVADRYDRRRVMLLADAAAGVVTAGLVLLVATGSLELWYIYLHAAVGSAANAFQRPAYLAAVTQLVPKQYLGQANGLVTLGTSAADLLAALVGGVLIGLLGLGWVIAVDVVTFLSAMAVLLLVRFPDRLWLRREETFWSEVGGGFRYIARRRPLVVMVVFFVVFNLLFALPLVLVPSFVLSTSTPQVVGAVLAAGGLGALAGAVTMGLWGGTRRRALGMVGGTAVLGAGVLVTGLTNEPWVQAPGMFVVYAALVVLNAHWLSLIQTKVGIELQGRVLGVNQMLAMSTMPVGFLTVGPLTERLRSALASGVLPDLPARLGLHPAGGHLGLALVATGAVLVAWGVAGLLTPSLRLMEDALPDTVPDAVQTWDRDELQRRADAELEAFLEGHADAQEPAVSRP